MTSTTSPFAAACINEEAVFWLNASDATRAALQKAGAGVPVITQDDRFIAAQRAAANAAQPKAQP